MIREAPAMTVRNNLGELLNEVQYRGDSVMITKSGKPIAALIDIGLGDQQYNSVNRYSGVGVSCINQINSPVTLYLLVR